MIKSKQLKNDDMNKDKTSEIGESIKTKFENFAGIEKLEGLS